MAERTRWRSRIGDGLGQKLLLFVRTLATEFFLTAKIEFQFVKRLTISKSTVYVNTELLPKNSSAFDMDDTPCRPFSETSRRRLLSWSRRSTPWEESIPRQSRNWNPSSWERRELINKSQTKKYRKWHNRPRRFVQGVSFLENCWVKKGMFGFVNCVGEATATGEIHLGGYPSLRELHTA